MIKLAKNSILIFTAVLLFIALLPELVCAQDYLLFEQPQKLYSTKATLNGKQFELMLARTPIERERGLMFFKSIAPDFGMLFIYNESRKMSFWMRNTRIPLDLIFFSEDLKVTEYIKNMLPGYGQSIHALPHYNSKQPARYALELKAGSIESLNIKIGDKLEIPLILLYSD